MLFCIVSLSLVIFFAYLSVEAFDSCVPACSMFIAWVWVIAASSCIPLPDSFKETTSEIASITTDASGNSYSYDGYAAHFIMKDGAIKIEKVVKCQGPKVVYISESEEPYVEIKTTKTKSYIYPFILLNNNEATECIFYLPNKK